MIACEICGVEFKTNGRARICSNKCRQRKYRMGVRGKRAVAEYNLRYKREDREWECFRCGSKFMNTRKRVLCNECIEFGKLMGYKNASQIFSMRRWKVNNPDKAAAYKKISSMQKKVDRGTMDKGYCEICGAVDRIEWHHHDYRKPLEVIPVCKKHHRELHSWDSN